MIVSDSGLINENLFVDWLHHFITFAKPTIDSPVLLILNNHESHVSFSSYLLCRKNGIILLSLPPHTSHRLQPLDLTYFEPLKNAYNRERDLYMASNVYRRITQYDVLELFTKAYNRISNIEKAANGFQAAGILPLNPNQFDDQFLDVISSPQLPSSNRNSQIEVTPEAQIPSPSNLLRLETSSATLDNSIPLREVATVPNLPQPQTKRKEKEQKKQVKEQNLEKTESKNKNKKGTKNLKKIAGCNEALKEVPRKKKKVPEESGKENEYYCLICGDKYEDPPTEDWIKCYKCSSWADEKCTSGESTSRGYICDFCEH
ncbi:hypothetical protein ILUMI_06406 [Ignelater luminosus]|uniref:DDE-1 domain-containing protein n=1 Tax=Ignelater luminosus TaxID=2038154 RepID=A0A8K0DFM1_IGNLU|nr:hypothetical protein ILUMI_06406 [Ignelater luminosus]